MEVLPRFSDFSIKRKQLQKSKIVVSEMEKIVDEFYTAYKKAGVLVLVLVVCILPLSVRGTAGSVD